MRFRQNSVKEIIAPTFIVVEPVRTPHKELQSKSYVLSAIYILGNDQAKPKELKIFVRHLVMRNIIIR